jgi:cysteine sulfinate desulfinase/cysteine desulfurase-like protein
MGMENERAKGALRLSLGWSTTEAEVAEAGATVVKVLRRLGA